MESFLTRREDSKHDLTVCGTEKYLERAPVVLIFFRKIKTTGARSRSYFAADGGEIVFLQNLADQINAARF
jgi:hypothetical protein